MLKPMLKKVKKALAEMADPFEDAASPVVNTPTGLEIVEESWLTDKTRVYSREDMDKLFVEANKHRHTTVAFAAVKAPK